MAFHKSNFGSFGDGIPCDRDGYVPESGDNFEDFNFGDDLDADGFEEFVEQAAAATERASAAVDEWRRDSDRASVIVEACGHVAAR